MKANIVLIDGIMPSYFKGTMLIRRESFSVPDYLTQDGISVISLTGI